MGSRSRCDPLRSVSHLVGVLVGCGSSADEQASSSVVTSKATSSPCTPSTSPPDSSLAIRDGTLDGSVVPYRETEKEIPNRFASAMARRTHEELLVITNGPAADWQPEAVEAARKELETRGLTAAEREEIVERVEAARESAREPLEPWKRPVALAAGALGGLLGGIVVMYFNRKHLEFGETGKSQEMRNWFLYGLVLHVIVALARCT